MGVDFPHPDAYKYGWPRIGGGRGGSGINWDLYGPAPNHKNNKINYAFADGHVEAMKSLWPWNDTKNPEQSRSKYFHPKRKKWKW